MIYDDLICVICKECGTLFTDKFFDLGFGSYEEEED